MNEILFFLPSTVIIVFLEAGYLHYFHSINIHPKQNELVIFQSRLLHFENDLQAMNILIQI